MGLSTLCMKFGNSLGFKDRGISAGALVHDSRSQSSLELATLHFMAVDFAKTRAPAEMPRFLKLREFPDFMQRVDKPMYASLEVHDSKSQSSLELATLHFMAVDFAKTRAPAEMPRSLKPWEFPDFMQRVDKPMYASLEPMKERTELGNGLRMAVDIDG
ncbi:RNA-dependent RNA polymerase [Theobroma cacao]|nr:RNA-dependent RNA polymerase [Theobroma cacao]